MRVYPPLVWPEATGPPVPLRISVGFVDKALQVLNLTSCSGHCRFTGLKCERQLNTNLLIHLGLSSELGTLDEFRLHHSVRLLLPPLYRISYGADFLQHCTAARKS